VLDPGQKGAVDELDGDAPRSVEPDRGIGERVSAR